MALAHNYHLAFIYIGDWIKNTLGFSRCLFEKKGTVNVVDFF